MNTHQFITLILSGMLLISSCSQTEKTFDASGSFEAVETIVSAEANGVIKSLKLEEGEILQEGQYVGYVDTIQLHLKKEQTKAQILAILGKKPNVNVQLAALESQLTHAQQEKLRTENLVQGDAATPKQLDDIKANINVLKKQIAAQKSSLAITSEGLEKEVTPLEIQLAQIEDQIQKSKIMNPTEGTVLSRYAMQGEMATIGKALYKIANLSTVTLKAYISGNQLAQIKLNQEVQVYTDDGKGGFKETTGTVIWISDKAEFTPKTIQTKEERANRVYAIKVKVKNDGTYKIGMYGQIKL